MSIVVTAIPRARAGVLWMLLAIIIGACALLHMRSWISPRVVPVDFSPFYCAGKVVLMHGDPYLVEPLRSCEADLGRSVVSRGEERRYFVSPAPLPAYDFLPLAALALLPFLVAKLSFGAMSLLAVALAAVCLARFARLPLILTLAVTYFAIGYESTDLGQISPFAIALIAAAALAISHDRIVLAVLCLAGAMIQPQIAVFPLAAMFVVIPQARWPIVAVAAALAIASFAALGFASLEYIKILPIHSSTQVLSGGQYSLAAFLATLGVPASAALLAGSVWTVAGLATVIAIVRSNRRNAVENGAIVLLPVAFACLGGTFIHATQVGVALFAAATLARPQASHWFARSLALAILVVPFAQIPYTHLGLETLFVYGVALTSAYLLVRFLNNSPAAGRHAGIVTGLLTLYFVIMAVSRPPVHEVTSLNAVVDDGRMFASAANLRYSALFDAANVNGRYRAYYLLLRLPTWFAVITIAITASSFFLQVRPDALGATQTRTGEEAHVKSGASRTFS